MAFPGAAQRVSLHLTERERFHAQLNLQGDSNQGLTFTRCRARYFCPFLQAGRLYTCAMPALVGYFNQRFGYQITANEGMDIHAPAVTGRAILRQLDQPIETCRWCSSDVRFFPVVDEPPTTRGVGCRRMPRGATMKRTTARARPW